jgi:LacI family transcriptional regulator
VLASSGEDDIDLQREQLESLAGRRVDGIVVMAASGQQDDLQHERSRGTPMVLVDRPPTFGDTDSVTTTNRESSRQAVLQLAAYGHRHIALLGGRQTVWTSQERRIGYLEGLAQAGLRLRDESVRLDLKGVDAAERAVAGLLDLASPPTALFTAQNLITVGAMRVLLARGWQHRVALIGFDDFPLADMLHPAITVVRQDVPRIGRTAADLVLSRIEGDRSPAVHAVVPAEIVRRGSGELRPPSS